MLYVNMIGHHPDITLTVHCAITRMQDGTWSGVLLTPPFTDVTCTADSLDETRRALARHVSKSVSDQALPVAASSVSEVRLLTTTERRYLRGGEVTPVEIYVPAVAAKGTDGRHPDRWLATAAWGAGKLCFQRGKETLDFESACDSLAANMLAAMEKGVEGVAQDWSALRLLISTRKTFPTAGLQSG